MSRKEKLLRKFLERPESLKYRQMRLILLWFGFEEAPAKGSHVKFIHPECNINLSIPVHNNDCKWSYKGHIAEIIKNKFL